MTQEDRDKFILMDADIKEIKQNQEEMTRKVERLFEKASEPFLTSKEMMTIIVSIVVYTVIVSFFISDVKAMASSNKEKVNKTI